MAEKVGSNVKRQFVPSYLVLDCYDDDHLDDKIEMMFDIP